MFFASLRLLGVRVSFVVLCFVVVVVVVVVVVAVAVAVIFVVVIIIIVIVVFFFLVAATMYPVYDSVYSILNFSTINVYVYQFLGVLGGG